MNLLKLVIIKTVVDDDDLSRDSSSPTLEQVLLMGCQRGSHDNSQGNSTNDSDLSLLSSSGISSVESSLTELMVFLNVNAGM